MRNDWDMIRDMILKPRIVASLGRRASADVPAANEADMIELRLDLVEGDPLQVIRSVRKSTHLPIIATNRSQAEGGMCGADERDRIEQLIQAAHFADYVDIELSAGLRDELMSRVNKPIIVSHHDFQRTPGRVELNSILEKMLGTGAAIAKIAVTPSCLSDNLVILDLLLKADMPLCMIAMGEMGRHLRAIAPIYGSVLTYGYVSEATAPGQMSVSELRQVQRLLDPAAAQP